MGIEISSAKGVKLRSFALCFGLSNGRVLGIDTRKCKYRYNCFLGFNSMKRVGDLPSDNKRLSSSIMPHDLPSPTLYLRPKRK